MPVSCIDELQAKVPYPMKPPSTPLRCPYHSSFTGNLNTFSCRSSSPPSPLSPSSVNGTGSGASTTSDAEFPRTPKSNCSISGICRIADTSAEAGSPTPCPSPENQQHSDVFRPHYSSWSEDERDFDGLLDDLNRDQGTMKDIEQKMMETYLRHVGKLNASSFNCIIRYLEAIRERRRMRYYTSCWDVAVVQRREAVALSVRDQSKSDFLAVERELRLILGILAQRLSLPRATAADSQGFAAVRDKDRISIQQTDTLLATFKDHAIALKGESSG